MGTFIEACTQGFSAEERYFIKITLRETPMMRLIVNNKEYMKHMSPDYEKNAYVLVIDEKNCIPNKIGVKYYHLLNGFVRSETRYRRQCFFSNLFLSISHQFFPRE